MKYKKFYTIFSLAMITILAHSCIHDDISKSSSQSPEISFSTDTLMFDTVFTQISTVTRGFKVYNKSDKKIFLDKISLKDDRHFRIAVDGIEGINIKNISIFPRDSIYVFVEATINPNDPLSASPYIIEDIIDFEFGGKHNQVIINAFGQDANYLTGINGIGKVSILTCEFGEITFDDPKPYIIYGVLIIDECKINIPAGTKIYIHGGIVRPNDTTLYSDGQIIVSENGTIHIEGTPRQPVTIQSDRLEDEFRDIPGQYQFGIRFLSGSKGNKLIHTIFRNANNAIRLDSSAELYIDKCIFLDNIVAIGTANAQCTANNSLFYNNYSGNMIINQGGNYELNHCTMINSFNSTNFANIYADDVKCVSYNDRGECIKVESRELGLKISNSIITNDHKFSEDDNEIFIDGLRDETYSSISISNSIIKYSKTLSKTPLLSGILSSPDNIRHKDQKLFQDSNNNDFSLDSLSIAIDRGVLSNTIFDLKGTKRDSKPDIGCYEYYKATTNIKN